MANLFDKLLVLLPFEPPYFHKEGLKCDFVGHPIVEDITCSVDNHFRKKYNISESATVICIMTGSRKGEVRRLLPIMQQTIELIQKQILNLHIIMPTVPHIKDMLSKKVKNITVPVNINDDYKEKISAYKASNIALVKSVTSALEMSLAEIQIVITYKINTISAYILRKIIKINYVNIINILSNKKVIPELLQEECNPEMLSKAVLELLQTSNSNQQLEACTQVFKRLGLDGDKTPSMHAAESILEELQ